MAAEGRLTLRPLAIDLFCGLGGWTEGFLAEGYEVIGFDIENHVYGEHRYPAELVIQDVRTIHGSQFKDAAIIVASSPCQKYSYMAMPWTRAKELGKWYRDPAHPERLEELNELFNQPRRIQREAIEAAGGRFIPLIQENVKGAQPWVGKAQWHYGSYYLWGDVPALMPHPHRGVKVPGMSWSNSDKPGYKAVAFNDSRHTAIATGVKVASASGRRTDIGKGARFTLRDCGVERTDDGVKGMDNGGTAPNAFRSKYASKSPVRKAAAAAVAKIHPPWLNTSHRSISPARNWAN